MGDGSNWRVKTYPSSYLAVACLVAALGLHPACRGASPSESLKTLQVPAGFKVDLVASEPLIDAPVAFDWAPDGRLWVVEMRDYPLGMDNHGKPGGRIMLLKDTNGDGKYDTATVFLDNLLFPNGVMSWEKGVLITCAPDIIYAEDTDGDGRADNRVVLFSGFGEANPQHRVNGLRWGLDNWVYCANGDFTPERTYESTDQMKATGGGFSATQGEDLLRLATAGASIRSTKTDKAYNIRNRDFRIRPDEGLLDAQTGQAQFGRDRDNWGEWFGCNHENPIWHFALDDYYLRRNPHVNYPPSRVVMPPDLTYPATTTGRGTGAALNAGGNSFTSSCSVMVYRDELLGKEFTENSFTCEPVYNLVHREVLIPERTTFTSHRAADEPHQEFFASTDMMCSPVMVRTGPDGALWIADMYRKVLEHPHWLAPDWERTIDVRAGAGQGRIYRVYPENRAPRRWPNLANLDSAGLARELENSNGWVRDKAQQLIIERHDKSQIAMLEQMATEGGTALGRLHALCTLDGLDALKPATVIGALRDSDPGVRRHAVRLTESTSRHTPEVEKVLANMVADSDSRVRMQLANSLGFCTSSICADALAKLLIDNATDPYIVAAAASSLNSSNLAVVASAVHTSAASVPPQVSLAVLQSAFGFHDDSAAATVLQGIVGTENAPLKTTQVEALASWLDSLQQGNTSLTKLAAHARPALRRELRRLSLVFSASRKQVSNPESAIAERVTAVRLLGRGDDRPDDVNTLMDLLQPESPDQLQIAAVTALGRFADAEALTRMIGSWPNFTPKLRMQVLDVLTNRKGGSEIIAKALDEKIVQAQEIPLVVRQRLAEDPSPVVRARIETLFADRIDQNRKKVVEAYGRATRLKGNPAHGLRLFGKVCSTCHQLGVVGTAIGPDLATDRDKPIDWFLTSILDPSRAVEPRFTSYLVTTKDGVSFTGILLDEGTTSITLVGATGDRHEILRSNIDSMICTGKSLMPEGFESQFKEQDIADIIAFLKTQTPPPRTVEYNRPALVRPQSDGSLRLLAGNCQIFGDTIHIEETQQCLGWWNTPSDSAVWTVEVPARGHYAVLLNWSCDDGSAKNQFEIAADGATLHRKVTSTGGWDTYHEQKIGEIPLEAGTSMVTIKARGDIAAGTYLFDLKQVLLKPIDAKRSTN
jgi:putative membrane-bound dehydrogenase-like protein